LSVRLSCYSFAIHSIDFYLFIIYSFILCTILFPYSILFVLFDYPNLFAALRLFSLSLLRSLYLFLGTLSFILCYLFVLFILLLLPFAFSCTSTTEVLRVHRLSAVASLASPPSLALPLCFSRAVIPSSIHPSIRPSHSSIYSFSSACVCGVGFPLITPSFLHRSFCVAALLALDSTVIPRATISPPFTHRRRVVASFLCFILFLATAPATALDNAFPRAIPRHPLLNIIPLL
jgi:hypothetical protein